jgi:hypothetical protein
LRHYLADFYSPIGRPSIDPELSAPPCESLKNEQAKRPRRPVSAC